MVEYNTISKILNKIINETYDKCSHNWHEFSYTDKDGNQRILKYEEMTRRPDFINIVAKAYDDYLKNGKEDEIWRVDVPSLDWLEGARMFRTENGSTFAIRPDGDIVAVCANGGDRGRTIMELAIQEGGDRLDAFEGIAGFYLKLGFIPQTYLKWDVNAAPDLWIKGHKQNPEKFAEEDVIFYAYDKNHKKNITSEECDKILNEFKNKNKPIKLKFNKKTYKAKTNKKGVATFNVKSPKKSGSYKTVFSYKKSKVIYQYTQYRTKV